MTRIGKLFEFENFINESDPSLRPPKKWFNKMKDSGKSQKLIGWIWYHSLSPEKRAEIRGREGKHYGSPENS
jgi:hypothetical protein